MPCPVLARGPTMLFEVSGDRRHHAPSELLQRRRREVSRLGVVTRSMFLGVMAPRCRGATVARLGMYYFERSIVIATAAMVDVPVSAMSRAR